MTFAIEPCVGLCCRLSLLVCFGDVVVELLHVIIGAVVVIFGVVFGAVVGADIQFPFGPS